MSAELHQQVKELFSELVELSVADRELRLLKLRQDSPRVASEVESLLQYHTSQSLVVPQVGPKIRTRATLSTTYQTSPLSWLRAPLRSLLVALPLFALVLGLSAWIDRSTQQTLRQKTAQRLQETVLDRVAELRHWEQDALDEARAVSQNPSIVSTILELTKLAQQHAPEDEELRQVLAQSPLAKQLDESLQQLLHGPVKFALWDRRLLTIADWDQAARPEVLGEFVTPAGAAMLTPILKGTPKLFLPGLGKNVTTDYHASDSPQKMLPIFLPIVDPQRNSVVAALMIRGYRLEDEFHTLLEDWNQQSASDTYLIDDAGRLLAGGRYASCLRDYLATHETELIGRITTRAPKANLLKDPQGLAPFQDWPLTEIARAVNQESQGQLIHGYPNYVGQNSVGAWQWLDEHEVGVITEEPHADAFALLSPIRWGLWLSNLAFALSLAIMTLYFGIQTRQRGQLRDVSEVGPYRIQELIGEGGMGRVYLAEHALLCRQSAIKVLTKGTSDLSVISRFEREVQLASQLTHPNTISIYDFGRNQDGVFYYAMEYINGAHLGQLVEFSGPLAPGRCIYILTQLCRALAEAHSAGVVHRDIKPQNIMVCNRGGEPDFLKLFDYGLVKAFAPGVAHHSSQTSIVVGTPRFMAPERLNSPWLADPRVDVYSVGALAYYLLTAQLPPLVTLADGLDDEHTGVETLDLPAAIVDFGDLLSVCMAVEPANRPSNMNSLLREFEDLSEKFPWNREHSLEWWEKHEAQLLSLVLSKRKKIE